MRRSNANASTSGSDPFATTPAYPTRSSTSTSRTGSCRAAAFADENPGSLAAAAAVTGGGVLFTRESEQVYQDRKHRFNL